MRKVDWEEFRRQASIVAANPERSWFARKVAKWSDVPERVFDERVIGIIAFLCVGAIVLGGVLVVYVIGHFVVKFW